MLKVGGRSLIMIFFMLMMASLVMSPSMAGAAYYNVPGTSDLWLAGMPNGSNASYEDFAPGQSPVLVTGISAGQVLTFTVTGSVSNTPYASGLTPDGGGIIWHDTHAENGISDIHAPINSLIGVFLDSTKPSLSAAPTALDFSSISLNFTTLSPELKQVFFIGNGSTGTGNVQTFIAPTGATRLYLGTMDGYQWWNNTGSFEVQVNAVPLPAGILLLGPGLAGLAVVRRKMSK
jgi:hypothetical protein